VPARPAVVNLRQRLLGLLLACAMAQAESPTPGRSDGAPTAAQARDFSSALDDYEANRWPEAYAAFALLADQGHAPAAALALQMLHEGRRRYGMPFGASVSQQVRWPRVAGGSRVADRNRGPIS